jgi:hypothetical protein
LRICIGVLTAPRRYRTLVPGRKALFQRYPRVFGECEENRTCVAQLHFYSSVRYSTALQALLRYVDVHFVGVYSAHFATVCCFECVTHRMCISHSQLSGTFTATPPTYVRVFGTHGTQLSGYLRPYLTPVTPLLQSLNLTNSHQATYR